MASFKFAAILCALLLAYQVEALPHHEEKYNDVDFMTFLKNLFNNVSTLIDQIVNTLQHLVDNLTEDQLKEIQGQTVDVTRKVLKVVLDKIITDVQTMGDNGGDAAKKLTQCIAGVSDDILNVPVTFWDDVSKCIEGDLYTLLKSSKPLVDDLAAVQVDAKAAAHKINDCDGNDAGGLLCVLSVVGELLDVVKTIPERISGDIDGIKDTIKQFIDTTKTCVKNEVPVYFQLAGAVMNTVATCDQS